MISIIIASYKEPNTIGKAIRSIADSKYSGIPKDFELIQISPDKETLEAGKEEAKKLKLGNKFIQLIDPVKGKPNALNIAFKKAKGDIIIQTDGDTYFGKNAIKHLLLPFQDKKIGGVTGRPRALNTKETFMGYVGNLLSDSGDHRRRNIMKKNGGYYLSDKKFFPLSGYILAVRRVFTKIPSDVLSDDAYMSYLIRNKGYELAYTPSAEVFVKFPTTLKDYFTQKVRSLGGYIQLKKYNIFQKDKQTRSFFIELQYALWVFKYASNLKELFWSLMLFPVRLYTWIRIYYERILLKKGMPNKGWDRILSTK